MPANRATSSGLPLGFAGSAARTASESSTKAEAVAVRGVGPLALTSTMRAWPDESKCESWGCLVLDIRPLRIAVCEPPSRLRADRHPRAQPESSWNAQRRRDRRTHATEQSRHVEARQTAD